MSERLTTALHEADARELRRATRALLRRPLLRASSPDSETYRLVRRHAPALRTWFEQNTGWRLHVDAEVARLFKRTGPVLDATRPARDSRGVPFSRRRYVLLCLALSVLERAEQQITLGRLAEGVIAAAADERLAAAGVSFELSGRSERGDLVAVVRMLLALGALTRVAGDEDAFLRQSGDVLYDVERRVMAVLISAPRGPSTISESQFAARLAALVAEPGPTSDELRNRAIRHRLMRTLLDDPVLYFDELAEPEHAYLTAQRSLLLQRASERTGLEPELRAEGIAMVDVRDELTDVKMPEVGTDGHVALLVTEHLAGLDGPCPVEELHALARALAEEHRSYWRRDSREPGAEVALVEQALQRLVALRLVRRESDRVVALPALGRFGLGTPTLPEVIA